MISRAVSLLLLAAVSRRCPRAPPRRARTASRPRAGRSARRAPRSRSREVDPGLPGPARLRALARRAASCCRSRARRPASTPPTCSTSASASAPARSPTTRARASARRCSTASSSAPAASARGRRAAARTSSTSTTSARRLKETGQIPTPYFPAGLAYGQHAAGRPHLRRQQPLRRRRRHQPARPHGHGDRPEDQPRGQDDRPRRRAPALRRRLRPQRAQGVRDELDGPLGVGDRHADRDACGGGSCSRRPTARSSPTIPNAIAANPRRNEVYTANGNSDSVSIINTKHERVVRTMAVGLAHGVRTGSMPNGLAVVAQRQAALRRARRARTRSRCSTSSTASASASSRRRGTRPTSTSPATASGSRSPAPTPPGASPAAAPGRTRSATARPATTPTRRRPSGRAPRAASAS